MNFKKLLYILMIGAGSTTTFGKGHTDWIQPLTDGSAVTYFSHCLETGQDSLFRSDIALKQGQIHDARTLVWNAWVQANMTFPEDKLPVLSPLREKRSYKRYLPEHLEAHAVMPFYWGYKGEKPREGYPLFLYLHGSGPKSHEWEAGWQLAQTFQDAPSAYFIPQIPQEGAYYRWWQKAKIYAWNQLLRQALCSGQINPDRIYCFGISEGGYGSQRLAAYYADYLAAAGPMAGGEPLQNAPVENCRHIGFSLLTGAEDYGFYRNKLTTYAAAAFDSLQRIYPDGFKHRIQLIPGRGHGIDYTPTTPWLSQFTRNPYPKQFIWEDFPMDGVYRQGFYNLYVVQRPGAEKQQRTCYRMDIQDNKIDLTVQEVVYETTETDPQWGIQLKFNKLYKPAREGIFKIYLCPELVDMNRKVTVTVNGKEVYCGKPVLKMADLINSCAAFGDPARLYPAAITVNLAELQ